MASSFTKEILKKTNYEEIIGLPPLLYTEEDDIADKRKKLILNTMNVLEVIPGFPGQFNPESGGLRLYSFDDEKGKEYYNKLVKNCLPDLKNNIDTIKVAFLNENSFSESWSNDFGESIVEEALNFGIPTARELRLLYGSTTLSEALKRFSDLALEGSNKAAGSELERVWNFLNEMGAYGVNILSSGIRVAEEYVASFGGSFGGMAKSLRQVIYGSNVDFPLVWRGSSFSPSYSITVRLFNPFNLGLFGKDTGFTEEQQEKFIIEPLVKLLVLAVPISDSNSTFFSPLLCRVRCPGLFSVKMGYISSIDVIKGGDTNDVSYFQKPGTIDVKVTFSDLYTSMVQTMEEEMYDPNRPTLMDYINTLRGYTQPPSIYYEEYNMSGENDKSAELILHEYQTNYEGFTTPPSRIKQLSKEELPQKTSTDIPADEQAINYYSNKELYWDESEFFKTAPTIEEQLETENQQLAEEQEFYNRILDMKNNEEINEQLADIILETTEKSILAHQERIAILEDAKSKGMTFYNFYSNSTDEDIKEKFPLGKNKVTYIRIAELQNKLTSVRKLLELSKKNLHEIIEQKNQVLPTDKKTLSTLEKQEESFKQQMILYNNEINNLLRKIEELSKNTIEYTYKPIPNSY